MGSTQLYSNNASATLAGAITNTSLTAQLSSGSGALFPHPGPNQYFVATLNDAATGLATEIVWVTNVTGDQVTMVRAQENTGAQNWSAGDLFNLLITSGGLNKFQQDNEAQAGTTNSAVDTGVANAYVVALTPQLTSHQFGMPIWWRAANNNSGASTFNDGAGSLPLVNPDGTALGSGTIIANGMYGSVYDGLGHFMLVTTSNEALSSLGVAVTGDIKWRPTAEVLSGWVQALGSGSTIGNPTSGASQRANSDTLNLFTWLWSNFANSICPVLPGGRGASALADFNSNKTIGLIDLRGKTIAGIDAAGSSFWSGVPNVFGTGAIAGSVIGENLHTLSVAELAVHGHANTLNDPTHVHGNVLSDPGHLHNFTSSQFDNSPSGGGSAGNVNAHTQSANTATAFTGAVVSNAAAGTGMTISNANNGSGAAHNNAMLTMVGTFYLKL